MPVTQRGERERVSYEGEGNVGRKWKMKSKRMKKDNNQVQYMPGFSTPKMNNNNN